jgi:uncharacterized protein YndB with AHSA1/START domain
VGDELHAFGVSGPDGQLRYSLFAQILALVPNRQIVLSWKNKAWGDAIDPSDGDDLASIVVLTFADNFLGAEIGLVQVGVPNYKIRLVETGEAGPASEIVNRHWSVLYWDPMRNYFGQAASAGAASSERATTA